MKKYFLISTALIFFICAHWGSAHSLSLEDLKVLQETPIIVSIDIRGNYPYMKKRVKSPISLRVGDPYDPLLVQEQAGRIERFFEGEGYRGTEVSIDERFNEAHSQVFLRYSIRKGRRYGIGNVMIEGNTVFPDGYFVSKINPLFFYRPRRVREALEIIHGDYQMKGYMRGRVDVERVEYDDQTGNVNLWLIVKERDHLSISFSGNQKIKSRFLKEELSFSKNGDDDRYELERSIHALLDYYRRKGFLEATVGGDLEVTGPKSSKAKFFIHEGVQTGVARVTFNGNKNISSSRLKKNMRVKERGFFQAGHYREDLFQKDLEELPTIYRERGYLSATVKGHELHWNDSRSQVVLNITLSEGQQTKVHELHFEGNRFFDSRVLLRKVKLKPNKVFRPSLFQEDQERLKQLYLEKGFAYVKVESILSYDPIQSTFVIDHRIDEGPRVTVGEIVIIGNSLTKAKTIKKALSLKTGSYYVQRKILESAATLRRLGAFANASIEPLGIETQEKVVPLLVRVEENKRHVVSLAASFDCYERFSGETVLTNQNLFGYAKRGNLRFKGGERLQRGEINYIDSHFAGHNLEFISSGFGQYENDIAFNAVQTGGTLSLQHQLNPNLTLLGRYDLTQTLITDNNPDPSRKDSTLSKLGLSATYDSRDYFVDPTQGLFALNQVDLATTLFGDQTSFAKFREWFGHYKTFTGSSFSRRFTFANNLRLEGIKDISGGAVPIQELLFVGGDYSVRGFGQDQLGPKDLSEVPTGGRVSLVHNFELLVKLVGNFKLVGFLDSGTLTNAVGDIGLDSLRHSAGFGLRYVTPLGPLRLDYGFKLDRQPGEGLERLHFTFGYPF